MKSVVVEASTVAKAIEIAWQKADKPEEFFIRILQEHQSGFLGFGAQKAKVVFFFKNAKKSESLFPVVLKQKEYASFFSNQNLKVPAELNFVDTEINKGILGAGNKKKQQHIQDNNQQQKNKPQHQNLGKNLDQKKVVDKKVKLEVEQQGASHLKDKQSLEKITQHKNQQRAAAELKNQNKQLKDKVDGEKVQNLKPQKEQRNFEQKIVQKTVEPVIIKENFSESTLENLEVKLQKAEKQYLMQESESKKSVDIFETKDDLAKDIARVLKKVQSQKIVANVSRPVASKIMKIEAEEKMLNQENVESSIKSVELSIEKPLTAQAPRPVTKLKRRPLSTENQGVSGIKPRSVQPEKGVEKSVETVSVETIFVVSEDKKDSN